MAVTLVGKLVLLGLTVAVGIGMTFTIIRAVNFQDPLETPSIDQPDSGGETPPAVPVDPGVYEVGVGIADMTGPIVEITFMGYAELSQRGRGLHLRQFSRAFIFKKGESRVVLVSAEVQAVGVHVRREVVKKLQAKYGDIYNLRNVIVTGTHTHSAPGGHLVDFLLDISILGFSSETFNAYVDGITRSIVRAHRNMAPSRLYFGQTTVKNIHINRSNYSYEFNPPEERARYPTNTDDTLTQLRITKTDGSLHGVLNWFAVHTTSMNMSNHLVSSDNLGYAALALEKNLNPYSLAGKPEIVAAFFSANLGDVSPNTAGARCEFSGDPCDNQFLLCGSSERCYSQGPGVDMFDSTRIVGEAVSAGALEVLNSPGEELHGDIDVVHQFVEMPEQVAYRYDPVNRTFTDEKVHGCVPAMGYSFASGTIDGANTLNITQGTIQGNDLLDTISGVVLGSATVEDVACHAPKPILLATGRTNTPLPWHPRIVSVSLLWLAGLAVAGVPGEPTTATGRRIRDVVGRVMEANDIEPRVVVSGLTNEYIHYVATYEEYQVQRYEAASTIYGPYTLDILLNKFSEFTWAVINGTSVSPGPEPADSRNRTLSLITPVILDSSPSGMEFGDVITQPPPVVRVGDTVRAVFVGANPRNNLKQESTHAEVQTLEVGQWRTAFNDADWSTKFHWERTSTIMGTSEVTFEWQVPAGTERGTFRLQYHGVRRSLLGLVQEFTATSNPFYVEPINT